jgi:hypothetical protein
LQFLPAQTLAEEFFLELLDLTVDVLSQMTFHDVKLVFLPRDTERGRMFWRAVPLQKRSVTPHLSMSRWGSLTAFRVKGVKTVDTGISSFCRWAVYRNTSVWTDSTGE